METQAPDAPKEKPARQKCAAGQNQRMRAIRCDPDIAHSRNAAATQRGRLSHSDRQCPSIVLGVISAARREPCTRDDHGDDEHNEAQRRAGDDPRPCCHRRPSLASRCRRNRSAAARMQGRHRARRPPGPCLAGRKRLSGLSWWHSLQVRVSIESALSRACAIGMQIPCAGEARFPRLIRSGSKDLPTRHQISYQLTDDGSLSRDPSHSANSD